MVRVASMIVNDIVWHEIRLERHGSVAEFTIDGSNHLTVLLPKFSKKGNLFHKLSASYSFGRIIVLSVLNT